MVFVASLAFLYFDGFRDFDPIFAVDCVSILTLANH